MHEEKIAAAHEAFRIAALPRRLEYAEPGSVALPRHVFDWLQNPATGSLDLPTLGALVGLLFSFENQKPILAGAMFEKRDEELVLVCSEPFDRLRFTRAVNPNEGREDFGTSGRVKAQTALRYRIHNSWLAAEVDGGKVTIRLGERATRLREAKEVAREGPLRPAFAFPLVQSARLELASARLAVTFATSRRLGVPSLR